LASSLGLESTAFGTCVQRESNETVDADITEALRLGVRGTPAFFVGRRLPDGRVAIKATIRGARPLEDFVRAFSTATRS
jgi:protein-disulfide isomerase